MLTLNELLNAPKVTESYTNQYSNHGLQTGMDQSSAQFRNIERQVAKIEPVQQREYEEPIALRDVPLGCTSLTVFMDFAVFVSDNRGRIHVWTPIYEPRGPDERPTRRTRPSKCVYEGNPDHMVSFSWKLPLEHFGKFFENQFLAISTNAKYISWSDGWMARRHWLVRVKLPVESWPIGN